jgi:mono/diheme cytochrome c family protein
MAATDGPDARLPGVRDLAKGGPMPVPSSGERRPAAGLRRAAGALAVAAAAASLWVGTITTAAAPLPQQEPPRTGGQYWYGRYCPGCHGGRGEGTPIGPPLVGRPDSPLAVELLMDRVRNPLLLMPDFQASAISDEKLLAIAEYIQTLEPAR